MGIGIEHFRYSIVLNSIADIQYSGIRISKSKRMIDDEPKKRTNIAIHKCLVKILNMFSKNTENVP